MKRETQKEKNPFLFSDSNKRYYTYDYYLRQTFGEKCEKLPLDGGFTCPNIDGRCGRGGCIYCSGRGSGDFAESALLAVPEQYRRMREKEGDKWSARLILPYFQAHTNTYAPLSKLKALFEEALLLPGAVGLNIATRADCLPDDVLSYLAELSKRTHLTVELGLQTSDDESAAKINRGHSFSAFREGYFRLRQAAPRARIGVHLIFGLPGENADKMLQSVRDVAALLPDEVKIHLLYVLRGTRLYHLYATGEYQPMAREDYIRTVVRALELLPPQTVIGRLTGDAPADELIAPEWSRKKLTVLNDIDKLLYAENTFEGRLWKKE